jgi:NitT/TauT family transport system substrate-binding protein
MDRREGAGQKRTALDGRVIHPRAPAKASIRQMQAMPVTRRLGAFAAGLRHSVGSMPIKIAIPDLISNSYFPILAARELGLLRAQGLDASLVLMSPADKAYQALKDGEVDFVVAEAHAALMVFPRWRGVKLICALAQGMYWFLVMRSDLDAKRGDLQCVRGRRIGASPSVDLGLKRLLVEAGLDPAREGIAIAPIPGGLELKLNTGVTAAKALESGAIDGFWANGMGAEIAVRRGVGTIVLDVRRGDGPVQAFSYTLAAVATTDRMIQDSSEAVAAVVRAVVTSHEALRNDVSLATLVGRKSFPALEAELIRGLVMRDLPFYDASLSRHTIASLNRFARDMGLLDCDPSYEDVVASEFQALWIPEGAQPSSG